MREVARGSALSQNQFTLTVSKNFLQFFKKMEQFLLSQPKALIFLKISWSDFETGMRKMHTLFLISYIIRFINNSLALINVFFNNLY